jgi:putative heme-binding domain-containing protein
MRPPTRFSLALFALGAVGWGQQKNPFDTPAGVDQGGALFQLHCAYCHGSRGEGGRGADLTTGRYRRGGSDAELYATVRNGIPGSEMPAVRATDDEVWKMVAFVKKLGTAGLAEKATGNPAAGKSLFENKGRCLTCHSVGKDGGNLGPDLSDVGRRRDLPYLEESLVRPEADVLIQFRALQVVAKDGQSVTGIRLNEDDLSIQIRDTNDDLRSFMKENIREIRRDKPALMPSYKSIFSRKEMDDVLAYLNSLRGAQ